MAQKNLTRCIFCFEQSTFKTEVYHEMILSEIEKIVRTKT